VSVFLTSSSARAQSVLVNDAGDATHACAVSGTGQCTLRDAILYANATTGTTISFNIPGSGVQTISPTTALPAITNPTTIAGYSQPGSSMSGGVPGFGRTNAVILIELNGSIENGSTTGVGLTITGGSTQVFGLAIGGWATAGILLQGGGGDWVWGNFIGTNAAGTSAHANATGVRASSGAAHLIGGPGQLHSLGAQFMNLISGNGTGIDAQASGTVMEQNIVGLNAAGDQALPNNLGISIGASDVTVGDVNNGSLSQSFISGNLMDGILVQGVGATNCLIFVNNLGGTTSVKNPLIGNGGAGILVSGAPGVSINGNHIVGNGAAGIDLSNSSGASVGVHGTAGTGLFPNVIVSNLGAGVVVEGTGTGNKISQNSITGNAGLGIDLNGDGVTANDDCDADSGPNNLQNFPVLTSATSVGGSTTIRGTLNSAASTTYTIEFFTNDVCDPSGYGQGKTFFNSTMVTTDASCNATIDVTYPVVTRGIITATATDPSGNTSEFSACRPISAQFHTTTPCRLIDTRGPAGAWGAPSLAAGADRTFQVGCKCGVPATAEAIVFNFTVTNPTAAGDMRAFAAGSTLPLVSTMNWSPGQTRANNAVVTLGPGGDMTIHVDQGSGTVDFIADIAGYFE